MSEISLFLGQALRRPSEVRAVAPTGRSVSREMASHIPEGARAVAEIGAGTGTITRAILARGLPPEALEIYELNPAFCDRLRALSPASTVLCMGAQGMDKARSGPLDAVISGVPVLALPPAVQAEIVAAALSRLRPGAPFVQITYGDNPPLCAEVRARFGLGYTRSARFWANLPPARVFVFRQS